MIYFFEMAEERREERIDENQQFNKALSILNEAQIVTICSIDWKTGHPRAVPVVKAKNDGFKEIIFTTDKNSHKVSNFQKNPNLASLTIYDTDNTEVLYGHVEVYTSLEDLKAHWIDAMKSDFFKNGPESPNLCIIKFIPESISGFIDMKPIDQSLN